MRSEHFCAFHELGHCCWLESLTFLLSVQGVLILARLDMNNDSLGARGQRNRWEELGREEEMEMRNERELAAVQTLGPPGIYDACRSTIDANAPKASRSILGRVFRPFWERK